MSCKPLTVQIGCRPYGIMVEDFSKRKIKIKSKTIKIVPKIGARILRIVKGKKEWSFEGDPPFEVSNDDYEKYLKDKFEIYIPKKKEVKND